MDHARLLVSDTAAIARIGQPLDYRRNIRNAECRGTRSKLWKLTMLAITVCIQ
jgi:hypothetical protein